jgi:hypothetical protein
MRNIEVVLNTEPINKGESIGLGSITLSTATMIDLVVDHTEISKLLHMIKDRLIANAVKKTDNGLHEKELKYFLNAIKDEAA